MSSGGTILSGAYYVTSVNQVELEGLLITSGSPIMSRLFVRIILVALLGHFSCADEEEPKNVSTTTSPVTHTNISTPKSTLSTTTAPVKLINSAKLICYYNKLSQNRSDPFKYTFADVDSSICSHIIYSNVALDPITLTIKSDSLGPDVEQLIALKEKGIVVMVSLGGKVDSLESDKYSKMVNNGTSRKHFVDSTVRFMIEHKFQGLDVTWKYPTCWSGNCKAGRPADKANFENLLRDLSIAFRHYKFLLSVSVSPLNSIADQAYDIRGITRHVDWINLMTFDYNNETYSATAIHSPLQGNPPNTVHTVDHWKSKGAPASKLVLGIPTFGRTFTLAKEQWNGPNAPAAIGKPTGLGQPGIAAYYEICTGLDYQLVENVGSYAFKGDQWVSFDDVANIKRKGEYIKKNELAGAAVWTLDLDDFGGNACGQGKYPLITALRGALGFDLKPVAV